ncbi:MAG: hypothetical protein HC914_19220, partial [Chloroflexaceae bacterium]|nr:hypothetical protein [Chloroflexaceae bacterium]
VGVRVAADVAVAVGGAVLVSSGTTPTGGAAGAQAASSSSHTAEMIHKHMAGLCIEPPGPVLRFRLPFACI